MSNKQDLWSAQFFSKAVLGDTSEQRRLGNRLATMSMIKFTLVMIGLVGAVAYYVSVNG